MSDKRLSQRCLRELGIADTDPIPVGAYVASALMAANYSGEDVDHFLNQLEARGYAVVPLAVALAAEKEVDRALAEASRAFAAIREQVTALRASALHNEEQHAALHGAEFANGWTYRVAAYDAVLRAIDETEELT